MSLFIIRGIPPPMPTIKPKLISVNVERTCATTMAAETVPYTPDGKHAITILWPAIEPRV
ncbi:hypothetical protein BDV10DRAFT_155932 [Aspergillus recurvatus]